MQSKAHVTGCIGGTDQIHMSFGSAFHTATGLTVASLMSNKLSFHVSPQNPSVRMTYICSAQNVTERLTI